MEKVTKEKATQSRMTRLFENWKKNVVMDWGVVELTEGVSKAQKN